MDFMRTGWRAISPLRSRWLFFDSGTGTFQTLVETLARVPYIRDLSIVSESECRNFRGQRPEWRLLHIP